MHCFYQNLDNIYYIYMYFSISLDDSRIRLLSNFLLSIFIFRIAVENKAVAYYYLFARSYFTQLEIPSR